MISAPLIHPWLCTGLMRLSKFLNHAKLVSLSPILCLTSLVLSCQEMGGINNDMLFNTPSDLHRNWDLLISVRDCYARLNLPLSIDFRLTAACIMYMYSMVTSLEMLASTCNSTGRSHDILFCMVIVSCSMKVILLHVEVEGRYNIWEDLPYDEFHHSSP